MSLSAALAACAGGFNPSDINIPKFEIRSPESNPTLSGTGPLGPVPPDQFVNPDGSCASAGQAPTGAGIGLGNTECEVVSRAGPPENIDVTANERGQRTVTLTYIRGARPGIYRFTSGRLTVIDRAPEPPAPPKPVKQKKVVKKKVKTRTTGAPPPSSRPPSSPPPDGVWPPPPSQAPPPNSVWPPPPR